MRQPPVALRRCIRCGAKAVKPRPGKGRTTRFRHIPAMAIPDSLPVPTCGRCQSEYLVESESLAKELQAAYLRTLRIRARDALMRLTEHISQRWLEWHLGLSQGYLCRIQAGAGNPSAELVSQLALLCQDPVTRLAELERFWLLPDDNWLPPPIPPTRSRKRRKQQMNEQRANTPSNLDQHRAVSSAPTLTSTAAIKGAPPPAPAPASVVALPVEVAHVRETESPVATTVESAEMVESADAAAPPKSIRRRGQAGGLAAQASGKAHKFTTEEARTAGKKGGAMISRDREQMREIGRRGGKAKLGHRKRRAEKLESVDGGELGSG